MPNSTQKFLQSLSLPPMQFKTKKKHRASTIISFHYWQEEKKIKIINRVTFHSIVLLLALTTKTQPKKEKTYKLDLIKIENFYSTKKKPKTMKTLSSSLGENKTKSQTWQITHLEYMSNSTGKKKQMMEKSLFGKEWPK